MSVEALLADVLPSQGHRFILCTFGSQGDPGYRPVQRAFAAGDEKNAIGFATWGARQGANAYFASAGFMPPLPGEDPTKEPNAGRTAERATHFRCLRLDVDCGTGKPYLSKQQGLGALGTFVQQYQLPMPWIVDSGYGLHVYWPFDRDVSASEWNVLAQRLASACVAAKFDVDTTTTLDAARVLRLPGSVNYKGGGAVPVTIVAQGAPADPAVIAQHFPAGAAPMMAIPGAVPVAMRAQASELQQNIHQPYTLRGVLTTCPGMMAMLGNGGATTREPLWKLALDLVNKSDDTPAQKEAIARAISAGHAGFTEGAFQTKWVQVQRQDYHPPTCRSFANAGMPECATCPFNGRIASPLSLGRPQVQASSPLPTVTPLPAALAPLTQTTATAAPVPHTLLPAAGCGAIRVVSGNKVVLGEGAITDKLHMISGYPSRVIKDKGAQNGEKMVRVLDYKITEVERLLDAATQRSLMAITFDRATDSYVRVEFSNSDLADGRAFHSAMLGNGLYLSRTAATTFTESFMPEFLAQLQRVRSANKITNRCGWTDDFSGFVLGDRLITAAGTEHVRPGTVPEEILAFHTAGDEATWRRAMDIVLSGGADRQAVVALAIAAPLMAFTGLDGAMLNAYSNESGVGKSTLGDAALSVWGSPNHLRKSARDTANATWRIAGVLGNMPMVIDEFTNVDGKNLSDFVYTLSQGREKHRLTSDARLQAGGGQRWCLAAITTANNSVHDKLLAYRKDAVAEATRVFDLRLHPLSVDPVELAGLKTELQGIETNYGHLGPQLVQIFLSKPSSYWRDTLMGKIAYWDRTVAQSTSDRFRSALVALIEVGAALGSALGLRFDIAAIRKVIEAAWRQQLADLEAERVTPRGFVESYLNQYNGDVLLVGGVGGDMAMSPQNNRRWRAEIRGVSTDGKFRPRHVLIPQDLLRTHVRENNGNYKQFMEWITAQWNDPNGLVTRVGRMMFLEGQMNQYTTNLVEFSAALLNDGAVLNLVSPTTLPPAPPLTSPSTGSGAYVGHATKVVRPAE